MEMKWIAIAAAALAAVILSYVWHNVIFKDVIQTTKENKISLPVFILVSYVLNFVLAYGLYKQIINLHNFIRSLRESAGEVVHNSFLHGVFHGTSNSLFHGIISVLIITALLDGKGLKWTLVTVLYWIIAMALMGGIVGFLGEM